MVQTYHPPVMAVNEQTLPELQPIFTLLNSHSNKLYQEGYFLKLDDQDIRMRSTCVLRHTISAADF
jgi:CCR4-NOT transcriptional complex subunit CAF120